MSAEQKRALVTLILLGFFFCASALVFRAEGLAAFQPPDDDGTPWIRVLTPLMILSLAGSLLLFRSRSSARSFLGDEREQLIALRAGLLAKTILLMLLFGCGIALEWAHPEQAMLEIPTKSIGFGLAWLMASYLGLRAIVLLLLYGRGE